MAKTKPIRKRRGLTMHRRQILSGFLFISPWLVGIVAFFLINVIRAMMFSFNEIEIRAGYGLVYNWVGFDNFVHIFRVHGTFFRELGESVFAMLLNVPLIIFFSLFMAIILNRKFIGRGAVRAIFFLPIIMGSAAIVSTIEVSVGMIFGGVSNIPPDVMREQTGFNPAVFVGLLSTLGLPPQVTTFVTDAIANLHDVIRASGVQILIFLAALQSISPSMYEVAHIEGATGYEIFWKITIPMVSPLIVTNIVYTVVDTYVNAPVVETAHDTFLIDGNLGASAAMSMSSALLVCLVLFAICWIISRFIFYRD